MVYKLNICIAYCILHRLVRFKHGKKSLGFVGSGVQWQVVAHAQKLPKLTRGSVLCAMCYAQLWGMPARFRQIRFGHTVVFGKYNVDTGSDIKVVADKVILLSD